MTGAAVVDGGICVDLRGMKGISVDPEAQTVRAEGGVNWGEFDAATAEHGLVTPADGCRAPGSPVSRWAAGAAGSSASSGSRATT